MHAHCILFWKSNFCPKFQFWQNLEDIFKIFHSNKPKKSLNFRAKIEILIQITLSQFWPIFGQKWEIWDSVIQKCIRHKSFIFLSFHKKYHPDFFGVFPIDLYTQPLKSLFLREVGKIFGINGSESKSALRIFSFSVNLNLCFGL